MSYNFDGNDDVAHGAFNTARQDPVTLVAWIKYTTTLEVFQGVLGLSATFGTTFNDSYLLRMGNNSGGWSMRSQDSLATVTAANVTANKVPLENTWILYAGTIDSGDTGRAVYVNDQSASNSGTRSISNSLTHITVGATPADSQHFTGKIAEVAIYNKVLSSGELTSLLTTKPSAVAATNLIGYWPMDTNTGTTIPNAGLDSGGSLSVTGATFNADHPSLSGGGAAPTFDTSPTVQSQTASAYTISYNADANATTLYVGAYPKDATAPTASQLKAGTGAHGTASEATTGSADTIVLTPNDSPKFPIYDLYAVLEGTAGFSSVVSLIDEYLDPPSGFQFITADVPWGGEEESILQDADPDIVDGDIIVCSTNTSPGNYAVTMDPDGVFSYNPGVDTSRQSILAYVYDINAQDYSDDSPVTFWVNNIPPQFVGTGDTFLVQYNVAISPIDVNSQFFDEDDSTITINQLSTLPAGLSITNGIITGTPTEYDDNNVLFEAIDGAGESIEASITIQVGPLVPDVVGMSQEDAITAIEGTASLTVIQPTTQINDPAPVGTVISQFPESGSLVSPTESIQLTVSLGGGGSAGPYGYPLVS